MNDYFEITAVCCAYRRAMHIARRSMCLLCLLLMTLSCFSVQAAQAELELDYVMLDVDADELADVLVLPDSAYKPYLGSVSGGLSLGMVWVRIGPLAITDIHYLLALTNLHDELEIYVPDQKNHYHAYQFGLLGRDYPTHLVPRGHAIELSPEWLGTSRYIYARYKAGFLTAQSFLLEDKAAYDLATSINGVAITILIGLQVISLLFFTVLSVRQPDALHIWAAAFAGAFLLFNFTTIYHYQITFLFFNAEIARTISIMGMPLCAGVTCKIFRIFSATALISRRLDGLLCVAQYLGFISVLTVFVTDATRGEALAFIAMVLDISVVFFCAVFCFIKFRQYRHVHVASSLFLLGSSGGLLTLICNYLYSLPGWVSSLGYPLGMICLHFGLLFKAKYMRLQYSQDVLQLYRELSPSRLASDTISVRSASIVMACVLSTAVVILIGQASLQYNTASATAAKLLLQETSILVPMFKRAARDSASLGREINALIAVNPHVDYAVIYSGDWRQGKIVEYGQNPHYNGLYRSIDLHLEGRDVSVLVAKNNIKQNLADKKFLKSTFYWSLLCAVVVALVSMRVFSWQFARPLSKMTHELERLGLEPGTSMPATPLGQSRGGYVQEIETLARSFSRLNEQRLRSMNALAQSNRNLEREVIARTQAHRQTLLREHERIRLANIGILLGSVAHEIRNPLASISLVLLLLEKEGESSARSSALFQRARKGVDRCNIAIEELKEVSRYSDHELSAFEAISWLEACLLEYEEQNGVHIVRDFRLNSLAFVADSERLRRVLVVLLDNARQSNAQRHGDLAETAAITLCCKTENAKLHISIQDQGVGLSKKLLKQAFDPLYSTKSSGFGMGLTLARNIVERHNGELKLDNTDSGAVATVVLPIYSEQSTVPSASQSLKSPSIS